MEAGRSLQRKSIAKVKLKLLLKAKLDANTRTVNGLESSQPELRLLRLLISSERLYNLVTREEVQVLYQRQTLLLVVEPT